MSRLDTRSKFLNRNRRCGDTLPQEFSKEAVRESGSLVDSVRHGASWLAPGTKRERKRDISRRRPTTEGERDAERAYGEPRNIVTRYFVMRFLFASAGRAESRQPYGRCTMTALG